MERPATFDARVMQYLSGLRRLARKFAYTSEAQQDLVTDTIVAALDGWAGFREDGGFWNWLAWKMRGAARATRQAAHAQKRVGTLLPIDEDFDLATAAVQEDRVDLARTVQRLGNIRHGDVLLRVAIGERASDIAVERGVSRSRIGQLTDYARQKLEAGA